MGLTARTMLRQLAANMPTLGVSLLSYLLSAEALVYGALLFYTLGFLFRDELWLRGLLLIGTIFYVLYYYHAAQSPLWEAILTSSILGLVNFTMIIVIALERTTFAMGSETAALYGHFHNLSPGQFRRIMKLGQMKVAGKDETISVEGAPLDQFFFVYDGQSTITKKGVTTRVPVGHFIGEVAFLKGGPATASVTLTRGSRYVSWQQSDLRRVMKKSPNLSNGLLALLNMDMAGKVATSQPAGE